MATIYSFIKKKFSDYNKYKTYNGELFAIFKVFKI